MADRGVDPSVAAVLHTKCTASDIGRLDAAAKASGFACMEAMATSLWGDGHCTCELKVRSTRSTPSRSNKW